MLQYHNVTPAAYLRAVRSGAVPAGVARAPGAGDARRPRRSRARRLRVQPAGARGARVRADRRAAAGRRPVARHAAPAGGRRSSKILDDEFVNFLFVGRIAPNKKIEDHIRLAEHYKRYVDAYYRFIFVGRYDAVPRYYATIRALMSEYRLLQRALRLHRPGARRGARRLLPARRGLHLAERARRLLRAAARGDGRRRAGPRLRRRRGARDARRRRRAVRAEGPRVRRRARSARWPSTTTCARRSSPASGAGSPTSATRASTQRARLRSSPIPAAVSTRHEDRLRRPALRHRGARRIRAALPAGRRAARRASTRSRC